jgi:hypothetical protein
MLASKEIQMTKTEKGIILSLGVSGFGLWLASNPRCNHGCKTVAQHLLAYGLNGLFANLIG